jgi:ABC-type transport system involved in cytochrome c biogenesis ATPase subunit
MNQNSFIPSEFSSTRSGNALLSVDKLAFDRSGEMLFKDVAFDVEAGQVLQIHGPNGSGKTTLLRVLAGLLQPSAGTVRWRALDAESSDVLERCIAGHIERGGIVLMTTHKLIATAPSATRNLYFEPCGRCSD